MKHGNFRRLTRAQKIALSQYDARYKPDNWLYKGESGTMPGYVLVHRNTGKTITIPKTNS